MYTTEMLGIESVWDRVSVLNTHDFRVRGWPFLCQGPGSGSLGARASTLRELSAFSQAMSKADVRIFSV